MGEGGNQPPSSVSVAASDPTCRAELDVGKFQLRGPMILRRWLVRAARMSLVHPAAQGVNTLVKYGPRWEIYVCYRSLRPNFER